MNVWKISWKNLKSKPLYTFLSVFALSLSILLLLGVQQIKSSFEYQMENNLGDIDLVIGAKGSPLQLVLASILHIDNPTGNISYDEAKKITKNPLIETTVPISYGDNYKGFRIVGTTGEFVHLYNANLESGRDVEKPYEVVIGFAVANATSLEVGDTFLSSHGLIDNDFDVHDEKFTVVGILESTEKIIDRLIISDLQSIWDVHDHEGHDHESHAATDHNEHHEKQDAHNEHAHDEHEEHNHDKHLDHEDHDNHSFINEEDENHTHGDQDHESNEHEHNDHKGDNHEKHIDNDKHEYEGHHHEEHEHAEHDEDKMITSLLVSFRNPTGLLTLPRSINEDTNMQAALPKYELDKLYNYMGIGLKTITWIAYLILLISGLTIFISLYKMVKERAFDLALMRTYGATQFQLIRMVAYEGFVVICVAFIIGLTLVKLVLPLMLKFAKVMPYESTLKQLPFKDILSIGILVFLIIAVSIGVAVYPIMKMKVSEILSDEK